MHGNPGDQVHDEVAAQADAIEVDTVRIDVRQGLDVIDHRQPVVNRGDHASGGSGGCQIHVPAAIVGHGDDVTFLQEALPNRSAGVAARPTYQLLHAAAAGCAVEDDNRRIVAAEEPRLAAAAREVRLRGRG